MESGRLAWRNALAEPQRPLLAACVLALLLLIGWELWTTISAALYTPAVATRTATTAVDSVDSAERIAAADLFGRSAAGTQNGEQALPETQLQLVLRGVFSASNPEDASAIIETGEGIARVVRVGVSIAEGTVLQQVYDNRVVLARNGALESLYFPTPEDNTGDLSLVQNNTESDTPAATGETPPLPYDELSAEQKRANILRRLEELRARSSR